MLVARAVEMREIDRRTIEEVGIPGLILMENAGRSIALEAPEMVPGGPVLVLAGKGNNGGDGFVAARHLHCMGWDVEVCLVGHTQEVRGDARINLDIYRGMGLPFSQYQGIEDLKESMGRSSLIIDALLGTGFTGVPRAPLWEIIDAMNSGGKPILSVDVPSGVDADTGQVSQAVRASVTVTLGLVKRGLLLYPGAHFSGNITVADISIPPEVVRTSGIRVKMVTEDLVRPLLCPRRADAHKGDFGHVLVVAGSLGFAGAAMLTALGALRSGAGLVTVAVPACIQPTVASGVKEAMTKGCAFGEDGRFQAKAAGEILEVARAADVLALGPGMGRGKGPRAVVEEILRHCQVPIVLDADGLNNVGAIHRSDVVMTPHPGEMSRLTARSIQEIQGDRIGSAMDLASAWGATVLLKGPPTVVASEGSCYLNPNGNPGMATGGSGDVLTGVISALMAQGLKPGDAAWVGAFLHGAAGDEALNLYGQRGLIAGDIAECLPKVLSGLEGNT